MALSIQGIAEAVLAAIKPVLAKSWNDVQDFAKTESTKLAQTLANIEQLKLSSQIDEDQARALLDMQKQAMQSVLLAVEGIGLVTAQSAINAGLGAIKGLVNGALGFPLIA